MRRYGGYFRLRLVKAKRILLPLSLSFLLTFSMNAFRSVRGFSATLASFLFGFLDTGLIIAYVGGAGQISSHTQPAPKGGFTPLIHPVETGRDR
jgi:hypothetical protein